MYVGVTKDTDTRWNDGEGYVNNKAFYQDISNYGWDMIKHEIIEECSDKETAANLETALIVLLKVENPTYGYNQTSIADNAMKKYHSRVAVNQVKLKKGMPEESFFEASGVPISAAHEMIDEWIYNKVHREMCVDRLINGMTYDEIAEKYKKSVRQTKNIVYQCCLRLENHF
jgi:hypothetical protein